MIIHKFDVTELLNPELEVSAYLDKALFEYTDFVFEAFSQNICVINDGEKDRVLEDETSCYIDENIALYYLEEKIDTDTHYLCIKALNSTGQKQMNDIHNFFLTCPGYAGVCDTISFIGVVYEDVPQCIPCRKKREVNGQ